MFTEPGGDRFEPGFAGQPATGCEGGQDRRVGRLRWAVLDVPAAEAVAAGEAAGEAGEPEPEPARSLLFDENEVARLCSAAASRARADQRAEDRREFDAARQLLVDQLVSAFERWIAQDRAAWEATRARAARVLAAALRALAPSFLARVQEGEIEAAVGRWLARLDPGDTARVHVPQSAAPALAAALEGGVGRRAGVALEVVGDPELPPGAFRIERGFTLIEGRPEPVLEALAGALEDILGSSRGNPSAASSAPDGEQETGDE